MGCSDAAQAHVFGRDVGAGAGGGERQVIVAGVGAVQADLGDAHPFTVGHVLVFKMRGLCETDVVARHDVAGAATHAGIGQAVIDLVVGGVADVQALGGDVGGVCGAAVLQAVIARIGAP